MNSRISSGGTERRSCSSGQIEDDRVHTTSSKHKKGASFQQSRVSLADSISSRGDLDSCPPQIKVNNWVNATPLGPESRLQHPPANIVDEDDDYDKFRGTLWACTTRREGGRDERVRPHNKAVYDRALALLQGAMVSGMLSQNDEVGFVRWWHDEPMDLSNHMAQVWQMTAQIIIRQKKLLHLPDTRPDPLEARSVCIPLITNKQ
jgi:hypothetical protein